MTEEKTQENRKSIGVFDSGVGGLTVFRELMNCLPMERLIYFGDTARVPYGSKSRETVTRYSRQIVRFLRTRDVKAIVVACNTASAMALDEIEEEASLPCIGVVKPGARAAAAATGNNKIGVIGTEATIHSGIYERFISEIAPEAEIFGKACPLFVPLAEEGLWEDPVTEEIARRYLSDLLDTGIDTLIMGCTHYPLLKKTIGRVLGEEVTLVNPAFETARALKEELSGRGLINDEPIRMNENAFTFFVSDEADKFRHFANSILPLGILGARKVDIERY
ncbi:MAG: glutamate racemase [Lachnospiraceae bacterium]|nr:glutamate racemase [Lachnospiraceae bacterium]